MKATGSDLTAVDHVKYETFIAGPEYSRDSGESPLSILDDDLTMVDSGSTEKQEGVRRIEAVAMSWSTSSLVIAYVG